MFNKIKAIKNLRDQAKAMQNTLEEVIAEGEGARGALKLRLNGNQRVLGVDIDDALMADKARLVSALQEAFADAAKKLQKELAGKVKDLGGMQEALKQLGM